MLFVLFKSQDKQISLQYSLQNMKPEYVGKIICKYVLLL